MVQHVSDVPGGDVKIYDLFASQTTHPPIERFNSP